MQNIYFNTQFSIKKKNKRKLAILHALSRQLSKNQN